MKKLIFLILTGLILISSCVSSYNYRHEKVMRKEAENNLNKTTEELSETKTKLVKTKEQLHKLKRKTSYILQTLVFKLEDENRHEDALELITDLKKDFPDIISQSIEDLKEKIKIKKEKEARLKKPATERLKKEYDEIEGITWLSDIDQPTGSDILYIYIGQKAGKKWLRFRIEYSADSWLFIKKYTFKIDDSLETLYAPSDKIKREVGYASRIYETLDILAEGSTYSLIKKIANSKRTLLRHHGDKNISDREISKEEKQSLKTVLEAYEKL